MGIDVSADYFDTLEHDKSLQVIRDPKQLEAISQHFGHKLQCLIVPRDEFVQVGGLAVHQDNSTVKAFSQFCIFQISLKYAVAFIFFYTLILLSINNSLK